MKSWRLAKTVEKYKRLYDEEVEKNRGKQNTITIRNNLAPKLFQEKFKTIKNKYKNKEQLSKRILAKKVSINYQTLKSLFEDLSYGTNC